MFSKKYSMTTQRMMRILIRYIYIYIPKCLGKDEKIWPFSKNGQLTTKSTYRVTCGSYEMNLNSPMDWNALWKLPLPQRVLLFGWKCLRNAIPIRAIIKSKSNSMSDLCPICEKQDSIGHALMSCDYARST